MPRAEAGTSKFIANRMKAKGLTRLRWYCQICEKACRDENGFKCHTQSESHVRNIRIASETGNKVINEYSKQFEHDFLHQLKTSHGTKAQNANHFYNEFIADRHHIHMNSTKWRSLSDFAKHLGQNGICRVEETEKGLMISWVDNSPETLRKQAAAQKQERLQRNDEEREQRLLEAQVRRANAEATVGQGESKERAEQHELQREGNEKITLNFGAKAATSQKPLTPPQTSDSENGSSDTPSKAEIPQVQPVSQGPVKISFGAGPVKTKNVFAQKRNPLSAKSSTKALEPVKKISEAERIMKQELERKRPRDGHSDRMGTEKKVRLD